MNDDRLDQIQNVLTELVRIVGNTNAAVEELRADVTEIKADVAGLKSDVAELKVNVQRLEKNQQILLENQQSLEEELADFRKETMQKFNSVDIGIEYLANKLVKHDMQLFEYKRLAK